MPVILALRRLGIENVFETSLEYIQSARSAWNIYRVPGQPGIYTVPGHPGIYTVPGQPGIYTGCQVSLSPSKTV